MAEPAAPRNRKLIAIAAIAVAVLAAVLFVARPKPAEPSAALEARAAAWQGINWIEGRPAELNGHGSTMLADSRRTLIGALTWGESSVPDPTSREGVAIQGFISTSSDGATWTTIPLPANAGVPFTANGVAAGDRGFLAFGRLFLENASDSAYFSPDGLTWQPARMPPGEVFTWMPVATTDEFLVAGMVGAQPVVWASADGSSWAAEGIPAPRGVGLGTLSVTSAGIFLSGHLATDRDWDAAIWRRTRPGTWERIAIGEPEFLGPERGTDITRIVAFEGGLMALGSAGVLDPCQLGGVGPGMGLVALAAGPLLDVCMDPPAAAWVSTDGERWEAIEGPRLAGWHGGMPYLGDIAIGADGLVGLINEAPDFGDPSFGVWTTANGREWRRIGGDFARGKAYPQATFAFPDRFVVLGGTDDGHIVTWIGEPVIDP